MTQGSIDGRRVLVVAAVAEELGDLPGAVVGIGAVDAALGAAEAIARHAPDHVVLVGSAGAYHPHLPVGVAIVGDRLGLADAAVARGLAYAVGPRPVYDGEAPAPLPPGVGWASVCTTPAITTDPEAVQVLGRSWAVEHLETWGVARACARAGVRFVPVLGIANPVGPGAHAAWLAHRGEAEAAARAVVRAWIGTGG